MKGRAVPAFALFTLLLYPTSSTAAPVVVRFSEGVTRAFPVLRNLDGEKLAHGDLIQVVHGDRVQSRLVFRFKDGSIHDESVVFSQQGAFKLLAYRIVQRGPSFPETIDASVDRETGRYEVRYKTDEDSPEETLTGRYELPDDAYNGMLSVVMKNLPPRAGETVTIVAFTPKPRSVKLQLSPVAEERMQLSDLALQCVRYAIRPQLGLFASLLVSDVPDIRMWILPGDAPAFLRAEGPLYFMGPIWRIDPY
jgi:hypothetical protein